MKYPRRLYGTSIVSFLMCVGEFSYLCRGGLKLPTTCRRLKSVAKFGTSYFLIKIKILAKRKRELTTKFAIARNGCYRQLFSFIFIITHGNLSGSGQVPISVSHFSVFKKSVKFKTVISLVQKHSSHSSSISIP